MAAKKVGRPKPPLILQPCNHPLISLPYPSYLSHTTRISPIPLISLPYHSYNSYLSYLSHTTHISLIPLISLPYTTHTHHISSCRTCTSVQYFHVCHICPIHHITTPYHLYLSHTIHICPISLISIHILPMPFISVQYPSYSSNSLISVPYPISVSYLSYLSFMSVPIPLICTIPLIISNLAMYTLLCYAFSSPCSNLLRMDPPSSNETSLSTVGTLKLDIATPSWSDARTCSSSWGRSSHSWSHDQICHGTVGKKKALVMFGLLV